MLVAEFSSGLYKVISDTDNGMTQERERLRQEESERVAREEIEVARKKKEEEEAAARAAQEAVEREAALEQRRREKATALGPEPEKGPDVTQVSGGDSACVVCRMALIVTTLSFDCHKRDRRHKCLCLFLWT